MKSCDGCTMCCKLLGIKELDKPPLIWCKECEVGKGCKIYNDRPPSCQEFECIWIQSDMSDELKPDVSKVVLGATVDGRGLAAYAEDLKYLETGPMGRFLKNFSKNGGVVLTVVKSKTTGILYSKSKSPRDIVEKIEELKLNRGGLV